MLEYSFTRKKIWPTEPARAIIKIKKPYDMLSDLANGHLQTLPGIDSTLRNIEKVRTGEKKKYTFGGSDACLVEVFKKNSTVAYNFGEDQVVIPSAQLYKLLKDWRQFLTSPTE